MVLPIMQGRLRGYKWIAGSSNHGCWLGSYEYAKQHLVVQTVLPGKVVFDVGAHVGFYVLLFSELVGDSGQVVAFEPFPPNVAYLKKHLALNRCTNVTIVEAAVADRSGTAYFAEAASSSMGHLAAYGQRQVPQVSLDEWISAGRLPVPDYLKIDIEGAELLALQGAQSTLMRYCPTIFLATHGAELHARCCSLLQEFGYVLTSLTDEGIASTDEFLATGQPQTEWSELTTVMQ